MHLPGAGLGEDKKRHNGGLFDGVPQPRLLLSVEAWESGLTAAVLALFKLHAEKKLRAMNNFLPPDWR
jgi:hypothetical protein